MPDHNYLSLRHLDKNFGSFSALKNISLDIQEGEFVCFLGPSGCGKTTLLRIIAGLEVQTSGQIFLRDTDISRRAPADRDYGIVFQSYALFPNLNVAANVAYGLVNRKWAKADRDRRVGEILNLVGLPGSEKKYPSQLSGGQQQRIALARALATSPGLLLLDEPLSALDALERVRLRQEIRHLQQSLGVTTIMVTHDQEEAMSVADRIVVMNHGTIEQVGTPIDIYCEPASPFVADFVGKVNVLSGHIDQGGLRLGRLTIPLPASVRPTQALNTKVYLRPEDLLSHTHDASDPCSFDAVIDQIDFMGAFCHVHVRAADIGNERLMVHLALNFLKEKELLVGSRLRLKLNSDRIRLF